MMKGIIEIGPGRGKVRSGVSNLMTASGSLEPGYSNLRRIFSAAFFLLVAVMGIAAQASAPEIKLVSTSVSVPCKGNNYELAFVSANNLVQDKSARALGVALIPKDSEGALEPRVYCVYWFNAQGGTPTRRDDTLNRVGSELKRYNSEKLKVFFNESVMPCQIDDALVAAITGIMEREQASVDAEELVRKLKDEASINIQTTSVKNGTLSAGFATDVSFAEAIRDYIVKAIKPTDDVEALKREIKRLNEENSAAQVALNTAQEEAKKLKEQLGGGDGRLTWLLGLSALSLFLMIPVALSALVGLPLRRLIRPRSSAKPAGSQEPPPAALEEAAQVRDLPPSVEERLMDYHTQFVNAINSLKKPGQESKRRNEFNNYGKNVQRLIGSFLRNDETLQSQKSQLGSRLANIVGISIETYEARKYKKAEAQEALHGLRSDMRNLCIEFLPPPESKPVVEEPRDPQLPVTVPVTRDLNEKSQTVDGIPPGAIAYAKYLDGAVAFFTGQKESFPLIDVARAELQEVWKLCSAEGEPLPEDGLHQVFVKSRQALMLFKTLREQFKYSDRSPQQTREGVEKFLRDLQALRDGNLKDQPTAHLSPDDTLIALQARLDQDQETIEKLSEQRKNLAALQTEVNSIPGYEGEGVFKAMRRMMSEQREVIRLLSGYRSADHLSIAEAASKITGDISYIKGLLKDNAPEIASEEYLAGPQVSRLVEKYRHEKSISQNAVTLKLERDDFETKLKASEPLANAGVALAGSVSALLYFNQDKIFKTENPPEALLSGIKKESTRFQQLRLRLSSAILTLSEAIRELESNNRTDVIKGLKLPYIKQKMESLLVNMEDREQEGLFAQELDHGFASNWLHDLFRANLLLNTYFPEKESDGAKNRVIYVLKDAILQANNALLTIMSEFGYKLDHIRLLNPSPGGVETEPAAYKEFCDLQEVRIRIRKEIDDLRGKGSLAEAVRDDKIVVDVFSFPFWFGNEKRSSGRVATLNPSDWSQEG